MTTNTQQLAGLLEQADAALMSAECHQWLSGARKDISTARTALTRAISHLNTLPVATALVESNCSFGKLPECNAAQTRVAEPEKQEPIAWKCRALKGPNGEHGRYGRVEDSEEEMRDFVRHYQSIGAIVTITPLYTSPGAATGRVPVELDGIVDLVKEGAGFWRSCSGCYETEDGHPVGQYPYSEIMGCALGSGCSECGGIGAVWDNNDYTPACSSCLDDDLATLPEGAE